MMNNTLIVFLCVLTNFHEIYAQSPSKETNSIRCVKIFEDGSFLEGIDAINTYDKKHGKSVESRKTIYSVEASDGFSYEISSFHTDGESFKSIAINERDKESVEVLEFIANSRSTNNEAVKNRLQKRRQEWIKLCNEHNAANLVTNLYLPDAIYFNHKPLIIGRENLTKAYSYMNDTNYSLKLEPLHVEVVSNEFAFEIGQCSGAYQGKYLLVWKKNENDQWFIIVDSNI
jgi:ketosteroid isomerase-like protein